MRAALKWLMQDWTLKLAGIGIALLLWAVVKSESTVTVSVPRVPVGVSVRDPGWELALEPSPRSVSLEVTGPVREVFHLLVNRPRVVIPVEDVADSVLVVVLRTNWVQLPADVGRTRVEDVRPATVRLVFDPVAVRELPVWMPVKGRLPEGLALTGPILIEPGTVRVSGPRRRLARLDSIRLPALDLRHLTDTTMMSMDIDTAALGLDVRPASVRVRVAVGPSGSAKVQSADSARADSAAAAPRDTARRDTVRGAVGAGTVHTASGAGAGASHAAAGSATAGAHPATATRTTGSDVERH